MRPTSHPTRSERLVDVVLDDPAYGDERERLALYEVHTAALVLSAPAVAALAAFAVSVTGSVNGWSVVVPLVVLGVVPLVALVVAERLGGQAALARGPRTVRRSRH